MLHTCASFSSPQRLFQIQYTALTCKRTDTVQMSEVSLNGKIFVQLLPIERNGFLSPVTENQLFLILFFSAHCMTSLSFLYSTSKKEVKSGLGAKLCLNSIFSFVLIIHGHKAGFSPYSLQHCFLVLFLL